MDDRGDFVIMVAFLLVIGFLFGMLVAGLVLEGDINDLGSAICEETHGQGSVFVSYRDGELKCSSPVESVVYDGLRVVQVD